VLVGPVAPVAPGEPADPVVPLQAAISKQSNPMPNAAAPGQGRLKWRIPFARGKDFSPSTIRTSGAATHGIARMHRARAQAQPNAQCLPSLYASAQSVVT